MKKLVMLAILAGLLIWYFDLSRRMTEELIAEAYREQVKAFHDSNSELLCSRMSDDYRLVDVTYAPDGQESRSYDRGEACREMTTAVETFGKLSGATGGLLQPTFEVEIKRIELSPDRKSATVEAVSTLRVGEMLMARTRGKDRLIRRVGRILSQGGESKTWVYAGE